MTGLILKIDDDRVVKVAKVYSLDHYTGDSREEMEYMNDINRETLQLERRIYSRLGSHEGIITCFKASEHGIELAYAKGGDLEAYISKQPEPSEALKKDWILTLADALSYIHLRRVFVDEIALRNILIAEGRLQLADFGPSVLLPLDTDMDTVCENDLNARIEMLHLGWIMYSIATWRVCKYYYFEEEEPQWPELKDLPPTEDIFCGEIIKKCWSGEYISMAALNQEVVVLLGR